VSDIFISYANEDRERARVLAEALAELGWSVFWDRTIPAGLTWREFIGEELAAARSVLVAWSEASIKSQWVLEEAEQAKKRRILIPVFIQPVEAPFGFGSLQAADLSSWNGSVDAPAFQRLAGDMGRILGALPKRVDQAEQRQPEEVGRQPEASAISVAEGPAWRAGREVEPISAGNEEVAVESVAADKQARVEVEGEGEPVMTYLREKLLPGVIGSLAVVVLLGLVNAIFPGSLLGLMGGSVLDSGTVVFPFNDPTPCGTVGNPCEIEFSRRFEKPPHCVVTAWNADATGWTENPVIQNIAADNMKIWRGEENVKGTAILVSWMCVEN